MEKESKKMYTLGNLADSMFDDLTFCKERIWVIMTCDVGGNNVYNFFKGLVVFFQYVWKYFTNCEWH